MSVVINSTWAMGLANTWLRLRADSSREAEAFERRVRYMADFSESTDERWVAREVLRIVQSFSDGPLSVSPEYLKAQS